MCMRLNIIWKCNGEGIHFLLQTGVFSEVVTRTMSSKLHQEGGETNHLKEFIP